MKFIASVILSLIATAALATGTHTTPPPADPSTSATSSSSSTSHGGNAVATGGNANSSSGAISGSTSGVKNSGNSSSTAIGVGGTGGSVKSSGNSNVKTDNTNVGINEQGQHQGQSQAAISEQGQQQSANNEGNSLSVTNEAVRQAPSVAQGSFAIAGCAAAGNAGGSNKNGSAFLGFGFTSSECYLYLTAQAYAGLGQIETACAIVNQTRAAKRLVKLGIKLPTCRYEAPAPLPAVDYATKADVNEAVTRAFKSAQKK